MARERLALIAPVWPRIWWFPVLLSHVKQKYRKDRYVVKSYVVHGLAICQACVILGREVQGISRTIGTLGGEALAMSRRPRNKQ